MYHGRTFDRDAGTWEVGNRLFFPEDQALVVGWHVHLGKCFAGVALSPKEIPYPPPLPCLPSSPGPSHWPGLVPPGGLCHEVPTLGSYSQGGREMSLAELKVSSAHLPSEPSPSPPRSDLHLRLRSKSTLLWGEIFPLTAKGCGNKETVCGPKVSSHRTHF